MDEKEIAEIQDEFEDENESDQDIDDKISINSDDEIDSDLEEFSELPENQENKNDLQLDLLDGEEPNKTNQIDINDESDEEYDEEYYQKFSQGLNTNFLEYFHSETKIPNYMEIEELSQVIRDKNNLIIDENHKTIPILTKYEKTRILGQRAKQINNGSKPFINLPESIIDGYTIAELELKEKKIPFIIRRPLPNGKSEYLKIKDLEIYY